MWKRNISLFNKQILDVHTQVRRVTVRERSEIAIRSKTNRGKFHCSTVSDTSLSRDRPRESSAYIRAHASCSIVWFGSFFILHYDYYDYSRVLKRSLYLSSRPLASVRVAANVQTNTRACALVEFDDLWYLTICSTIVISRSTLNVWTLLLLHFEQFVRFIVIWCAPCHMRVGAMWGCVYMRGFFSSPSTVFSFWADWTWARRSRRHSPRCPIITFCWSTYCSRKKSN